MQLLKELVKFQNGHAFTSKEMGSIDYPVIKIKELKKNYINITNNTQYISNENSIDIKYVINKNDILVALTGDPISKGNVESSVGRTGIYTYNTKFFLNQKMCKLIPDKSKILNKYLYYCLIFEKNLLTLANNAKGSANQVNISHKDIGYLQINLPPLQIQQYVVNIMEVYQC